MKVTVVCDMYWMFLCWTTCMLQCLGQFTLKADHLNKRLIDYTIANKTGLGIAQCAQQCMFVQQCVSLNYCYFSKVCELNAVNSTDRDPADFVTDNDWNYADITAWPKRISRTCKDKTCEQNEECVPVKPEATCKTLPGCSDLPPIDNSRLKLGGTLVNTTRTYTCDSGYAAIDGSKTVVKVCQNEGSWMNENKICHAMCTPGTFSENTVEPCMTCPIDSYQPNQGQTECVACPPGTITVSNGMSAATDCKEICTPGTYSLNTIVRCTICAVIAFEPCTPCPINWYQPNKGQTNCVWCQPGTITLSTGKSSATDCKVLCSPGTFSENTVEPCRQCLVNWYQPNQGQSGCVPCPAKKTTLSTGSSTAQACKVRQWVSSVVEVSSLSSLDASHIIGKPDRYSWTPLIGIGYQYIEVQFAIGVHIEQADIHLTGIGGVNELSARDVAGREYKLWESVQTTSDTVPWILSINLQLPYAICKELRLDIDNAAGWTAIDSIQLHGDV